MTSHIATIGLKISRFRNKICSRHTKRGLIQEIVSLQILITAAIGIVAIGSLYWGGQWVLQSNYSRWALQWTEELNELGAPLYLPNDDEVVLRLESFVDKYPEIGRVTYFRRDGSLVYSIDSQPDSAPAIDLSEDLVEMATELVGADKPYFIDRNVWNPRQFEILAPVWTESIAGDGLFAFDPASADANGSYELMGFVGLHLDFVLFHDHLLANIKLAVLGLFVLMVGSGLYGRHALRKALMSISDLQKPLAELAKGNLEVEFKPAAHREISEIVEALETTTKALSERDAKLLNLANHDVLTGLFNRRRFMEELEIKLSSATGDNAQGALLFIDLDQFKYVNDACGHPAGDRLIRKVAQQLRRSVGQQGLVARFGGDEFVVLASNTSQAAAKSLARSILVDMRRIVHKEDDRVFHVHCSIGITMFNGDESDHDELMAQADIACREAKAAGRNRLQFYCRSDREAQRVSSDVGWMAKLREALDHDLFELRFQPIACIDTGRTTHHEVLLRLPGEHDKIIGPDAFLPAAIRFGLMSEIDWWVIRKAAAAYARHRVDHPDLRLSVNLSANAFETEDLAVYVEACFAEYAVPPDHIMFEITESLAVRHLDYVEKQITALRKLGCKLALDDFGTGYSSFSYLQRLEVDYIKIDGSFIRELVTNPFDQKMVRMMAEIGREAGMKTIAEYVQSGPALALLSNLGVDMAQGDFIGRPAVRPIDRSIPIPLESRRKRRAIGTACRI